MPPSDYSQQYRHYNDKCNNKQPMLQLRSYSSPLIYSIVTLTYNNLEIDDLNDVHEQRQLFCGQCHFCQASTILACRQVHSSKVKSISMHNSINGNCNDCSPTSQTAIAAVFMYSCCYQTRVSCLSSCLIVTASISHLALLSG